EARADYNYALDDPFQEIVTLVFSQDAHLPMEAVLSTPISFAPDHPRAYEQLGARLNAVSRRPQRRAPRYDLLDEELADAWRDRWQSRTLARIYTAWPRRLLAVFQVLEACWRVGVLVVAYFLGWAYLTPFPGLLFHLGPDERDSV